MIDKPRMETASPAALSDTALETSRLLVEFLHAAYAVRNESENGSYEETLKAPEGSPGETEHPAMSGHAIRAAIHVYQHGERTVGQIASGLGISYGWASRVVEELEGAHYLIRSRDADDRRIVHVRLDPAALERVEQAYRWRGQAVETALAPMTVDEQAAIRLFLRRVIDLLHEGQARRP